MDDSLGSEDRSDHEEQAAEDDEQEFERIPDGAGCVEIWERLSERREDD